MRTKTSNLLVDAARMLERAGIERPMFEAQLLLAHALGTSRADVLRETKKDVAAPAAESFESYVARRVAREPLAYIRGCQEFYGLEFKVSPAVLIPRPETELLVDFARELKPASMVDVGTGSGCIAIASSVHLPQTKVIAIDSSAEALQIAARNAVNLSAEVQIVQADLLEPIRDTSLDLVVSNPPYIPSNEVAELQPEIRVYEPAQALDGGPDGLGFIRRIAADSRRVLRSRGWLALEVAMGQADPVCSLLAHAGFISIQSHKDLAGISRLVIGQTP